MICVNRPVCVVGSQMPVHLPLSSSLVSRSHALIVNDGQGVYVRDLASRNRLYVNGRPVRESDLGDSDVIRLGPFTFLCRSGFRAAGEKRRREGAEARPLDGKGRAAAGSLRMMDGDGEPVPVSGRTTLIGRRKGCDLLLNHPNVSPVHAVIFERCGRRFVRDLNSTAGTFVNGRKVRETELRGGEELRLGTAWLRYENNPAPAPRAAAAAVELVMTTPEGDVGADSAAGLADSGEVPAPGSIAATLEDLAAGDDLTAPQDAVDSDELTAAEGLMAVARREDARADLATADDVFADAPGDVFRLRRGGAGKRRPAWQPEAESQSAHAPAPPAAPVVERYTYTYETGPAAGPVAPLPPASVAAAGSWLSRGRLGVRRLCRRLLGRTLAASPAPARHVPTSEVCESREVPTC